ncbi:MAG: 30S ribosomal protein S17 [Blastocatellia bacterium]
MSEETMNNTEAAESPEATPTAAKSAGVVRGRRTEKVGIVTSDKMTKTVVVRVDRLVKHPTYKRYVRKRTKFMAHNEIEGVAIGDQVRIVETRPLSAHKRWRVVEVLRKASR